KHSNFNLKSNQRIAQVFEVEGKWLAALVDFSIMQKHTTQVLGEEMAIAILKIGKAVKFQEDLVVALKKSLKAVFSEHRILKPNRVLFLTFIHVFIRIKIKLFRLCNLPFRVYKRSVPYPYQGVVVCLMGSD